MSEVFTITFAPAGTLKAFDTPNCDAWVIEGGTTFADFIAVYDEKSAAHPKHHILSSFDDYGQACYTSGHAMQKYDLDPPYEEEAEPLSSAEQFAIIQAKFQAHLGKVTFADLAGSLTWCDDDDDDQLSLLTLNTQPDLCLDTETVMQIVPVSAPEDAFAAFPNGYFTSDLTPFENHTLAAHLRTHHGYKVIAIGAAYLCFLRDEAAVGSSVARLCEDLVKLYKQVPPASLAAFAASLIGKRYLVLTYSDR
jgi:hypothetical protein